MSVRKYGKAQRQSKEQPKYRCRDCANSYDWQSPAIDGHLILCRCPYKQQGGKFCIFLKDPQCEHFKLRVGNAEETK